MTKSSIIQIAEYAITLQSMRQDILHIQDQEQKIFDEIPETYENSVIREIMLEDIDSLNDVFEGIDAALDSLRAILHNNK